MRHFLSRSVKQLKHERVATLGFDAALVFVWIDRLSTLIEILRADVKRLMNVPDIMGEQNHRDRFRNLTRITLWRVALQDINAVGNHVNDVPPAAAGPAISVVLSVESRDVAVMKPVMRRSGGFRILRRWVCLPEFAKLFVDVWMIGVMRECIQILDSAFVPGLAF